MTLTFKIVQQSPKEAKHIQMEFNLKQAGAELGQAQPKLGLKYRQA